MLIVFCFASLFIINQLCFAVDLHQRSKEHSKEISENFNARFRSMEGSLKAELSKHYFLDGDDGEDCVVVGDENSHVDRRESLPKYLREGLLEKGNLDAVSLYDKMANMLRDAKALGLPADNLVPSLFERVRRITYSEPDLFEQEFDEENLNK